MIEGIKNKQVLDKIYSLSKIKENNIFQPYLINEDIKNFSNILKNLGYLNNKINYEIRKIQDNKINVFYTIELNNKFKIKRIFFIGDKFFESSTLLDVVYSSEHGWWKFFSKSTTPTEDIINYDISKLKQFYLNNGFYDVQINSSAIKILDQKNANIIYSINSGIKYFINKYNFNDNSKSLQNKDTIFLKKNYEKLLNKNYDYSEIQNNINFTTDYLIRNNYDLLVNIKVFKSSLNKMQLDISIEEPKDKMVIDKIIVKGNNITDDFLIRNNLSFSEGDIFNNAKLESSIDKLKGKDLFKKIDKTVSKIDENKAEILITVEEQATGEISAGAGAGTNGAAISGSLNEKNFLGKGIKLNSSVNIGTQKIFGNIGYSDPDFNNSGKLLKSSIFAEGNDFDNASYKNKIIGASASINYDIYDKVYFNPGVSIDHDTLDANDDASALIKKRDGSFFTSKIFYNISKDTKNREFQATDGYIFGLGQSFSIISDIPFINNSIFGSYYNEYVPNFIGSVKYKLESINGFDDDIKFSDRLSVSSNNLRGFASRGIGPKLDNDFIGGNYSFYTSLSTTVPNGMPDKWNAKSNLFIDTANVWGVDDNSTNDSNKLRTSIGLGLSWMSPLGPISITYAEPITKANTDEVEQFNFKIGSAF